MRLARRYSSEDSQTENKQRCTAINDLGYRSAYTLPLHQACAPTASVAGCGPAAVSSVQSQDVVGCVSQLACGIWWQVLLGLDQREMHILDGKHVAQGGLNDKIDTWWSKP